MRRLWFCAVLLIFLIRPTVIFAQEEDLYGDFSKEYSHLFSALPEEVQKRYENVFSDPAGAEKVRQGLNYTAVTDTVLASLSDAWPGALSLFLRLFALIICAALFGNMKTALGERAVSEAFSFCSVLCFSLALVGCVDTLLKNTVAYLSVIANLSAALSPLMCVLTAATGRVTTATVTHTALMLLFAFFQNIGTVILIPVVRASLCFGVVGAVSATVRVDSITRGIKTVFTVLLAFLTAIITFVIGTQTVLAKGADSFSLKTVKFALGNAIPLIGGALSDAISTVSGSLTLIRSVSGSLVLVALFTTVLPILIQLILHRLAFSLCRGAAEMVGCDREATLIGEMHTTLGYMLAVLTLASLMFILVLGLFAITGGGVS